MTRRSILPLLGLLLAGQTAWAQPANDDCLGAIPIADPAAWCSASGAFTSIGAAAPSLPQAGCLSGAFADVWFSFVPQAGSLTITIIGNNALGGAGLLLPEIALFAGSCDALQLVACKPAPAFGNVNSLSFNGLELGQPHYILVQGRNGITGPFQMCLHNYSLPTAPSSDCPEAALLCDKSPFVVQQLSGAGNDPTEANDAPCLNSFGVNVESNSTWFVWTAGSSGSLTFTLTPLNPPDDLDFVVYEYPNGPGNCAEKIPLRCMASSCQGPTGLNESSTDLAEPPNCNPATQDNFLAALQMEEGKTYGVMVNNFSTTGMGFLFEFGGSGEFAGPQAAFAASPVEACIDQAVTFADASTIAVGSIASWEWDFGADASPSSALGPGPHQVSYARPGSKLAQLKLTTAQGCIVTAIQSLEVSCCARQYQADVAVVPPDCPGSANASIILEMTQPAGPYAFIWSNGATGPANSGLAPGSYSLTVSEALGCDTVYTFLIEDLPPLAFDTSIVMPTCNGGMDGQIGLAASGGTPPYQFSFQGSSFGPSATFSGLPVGDYAIRLQDANGCEQALFIPLRELELELDPLVQAIAPPSCFGFADGAIQVEISNGLPPYQYDFNDGQGYVDASSLAGLPAGLYQVDVRDANLCRGSFSFALEDPPALAVSFAESPISCYGLADGGLAALPEGGRGDYRYEWSTGSTAAELGQLAAGEYTLSLQDAAGCRLVAAYPLSQPDALQPSLAFAIPPRCAGASDGRLGVAMAGGTRPYRYRLDGGAFQLDSTFVDLPAGTYRLTVRDSAGCEASLLATLDDPPALQVDAGERQSIILGYEALLRAQPNAPVAAYQWSPAEGLSCVDCPGPSARPLRHTVYTVVVVDGDGCQAVDSVEVAISAELPLYIPNAFSPNADGRNDVFTAYGGPGLRRIVSLKVFDRWGGLAFERQNLGDASAVLAWDGQIQARPAPPGVYAYLLEAEFIDGQRRHFSGEVVLIR
jgi:gliding motility-associated-like protein